MKKTTMGMKRTAALTLAALTVAAGMSAVAFAAEPQYFGDRGAKSDKAAEIVSFDTQLQPSEGRDYDLKVETQLETGDSALRGTIQQSEEGEWICTFDEGESWVTIRLEQTPLETETE